jgi:hypothetical protein
MTTKFVFNALSGQFDLVTNSLTPSEIVGGNALTIAGFDSTGILSSIPKWDFTDATGRLHYYNNINADLPGYTSVLDMYLDVTAPLTNGFDIAAFQSNISSTSVGFNGVRVNNTIQSGGDLSQGINSFADNSTILSGGAANNGFTSVGIFPNFQAGGSMTGGYNAIVLSPTFASDLTGNGINFVNIGAQISSPDMDYINGVAYGVSMNSGATVQNSVQAFSDNSIYSSGSVSGFHSSMNIYPQIQSGSSVDYYTGLSVGPTLAGTTLDAVMARLSPQGPGSVTSLTGLDINLSGVSATNRKLGIQVQDGFVTFGCSITLDGVIPVDSINLMVPMITVANGTPVTQSVFGQNFANLIFVEDDWNAGPLGVSVAAVGYVGQTNVDAGKTLQSLSMAFAGLQASGDGTITDITLYDALGTLPGTGTPIITNLYAFKGGSLLSSLATNAWGINIQDTGAENYLSKSLAIGTATQKVSGAGIGLEIDTKDILLDGGKLTLVGNTHQISIQASSSTSGPYTLTLPIDDGAAGQVLTTDGTGILSWASGGGVTSVTASSPLSSSGGATPDISLTGVVAIANGGTNSSTALNNNRIMISSSSAIVEASAITASRALESDSNGIPVASSVTNTELSYLSGVTSSIQTQLNATMINPMTTGGDIIYGGASGAPTRLANGTAGQFLKSNGSTNAPSWDSTNGVLAIRSVTTTDTCTNADDTLVLSGASFTETLFTAVGNSGKIITLVHNGTSLTQLYTLATTSGQTIGGVASGSYVLYTNGETLRIQSDGSNWLILDHETATPTIDAGTIGLAATTTNPTKGTTNADKVTWYRQGCYAILDYNYSQTAAGSAGSGNYLISLPANMTADTTYVTALTTGLAPGLQRAIVSSDGFCAINAGSGPSLGVYLYDTTQLRVRFSIFYSNADFWGSGFFNLAEAAIGLRLRVTIRISGWRP